MEGEVVEGKQLVFDDAVMLGDRGADAPGGVNALVDVVFDAGEEAAQRPDLLVQEIVQR